MYPLYYVYINYSYITNFSCGTLVPRFRNVRKSIIRSVKLTRIFELIVEQKVQHLLSVGVAVRKEIIKSPLKGVTDGI